MDDPSLTSDDIKGKGKEASPNSTLKRKRDELVHEIANDKRLRTSRCFTPETDQIRDELIGKAEQAVAEPSDNEQGDLSTLGERRNLQVIYKLLCKQIDHAEQMDSVEETKTRMLRLLDEYAAFKVGDWQAAVISEAKKYEGKYRKTEFCATYGKFASTTVQSLDPELESVRRWREDGKVAELAPVTPHLDRFAEISKNIGMHRLLLIEVYRGYADRNENAHFPPPRFHDYLRPDQTIDWDGIRQACDEMIAKIKDAFLSDGMTEYQMDFCIHTIKLWERLYVSKWNEDGTPVLTTLADQVISRKKNNSKPSIDKKIAPPTIAYESGKWDDLFEET